jgi:hypothetical protein
VLDSQNERKYLHVFGEVDVGEVRLKDGGEVGELEADELL